MVFRIVAGSTEFLDECWAPLRVTTQGSFERPDDVSVPGDSQILRAAVYGRQQVTREVDGCAHG